MFAKGLWGRPLRWMRMKNSSVNWRLGTSLVSHPTPALPARLQESAPLQASFQGLLQLFKQKYSLSQKKKALQFFHQEMHPVNMISMRQDFSLENLILQHIQCVATAISYQFAILKVYSSENACVKKLSFRV